MKTKRTVGVVVGRFQTPKLHLGHEHILNTASNQNDLLCVILGDHCGAPTDRNPLDTKVRSVMITNHFPNSVVLSIPDSRSDLIWSKNIDDMIQRNFPEDDVTLYGSRDSFIPYYMGLNKVVEVEAIIAPSATEVRKDKCLKIENSNSFRKGVIYASLSRYPVVYSTVDIAVYKKTEKGIEILVGEKECDEGQSRFIGGFVDTTDKSHADAAHRELWEEVGMIEVTRPTYVDSMKVEDRRYLASKDSVITTLFVSQYIFGCPTASDDLDAIHWVLLSDLESNLISEHKPLALALIEYFSKNNNK